MPLIVWTNDSPEQTTTTAINDFRCGQLPPPKFRRRRNVYQYLECFNSLLTRYKNDFTAVHVMDGSITTAEQRILALEKIASTHANDYLKEKEKRYQKLLSTLPLVSNTGGGGFAFANIFGSQPSPWLESLTKHFLSSSPILESAPHDFVALLASQILRVSC